MKFKKRFARVLMRAVAVCAAFCSTFAARGETADVIIVGSTPAGIAAAVQLTRMGHKTILLSETDRIGGLTTGGLGMTDIGREDAFGGLALKFYRDLHTHVFGEDTGDLLWRFAPSQALAVLRKWETAEGLDIRRGERICRARGKVQMEKADGRPRIVSVATESGKTYRAKVFVDATYEGDLMAAAGVRYFIGREANATYGETIDGIQPDRGDHPLPKGIDPYVVKGNAASGLLRGVEPGSLGAVGAGDDRLQAYCYRLCLTDVPANRRPVERPADYDERDYEILFRAYEAGMQTNRLPFSVSRVTDGKTDSNNSGGFSFDWIGHSRAWPEASYAERAQLAAEHRRYQQGFLWTLANHPRIPACIRAKMCAWGLARDEFVESDNWPRQLYVREARRMIGDYVMTEHDCRGRRRAPHPVAQAAYMMDSHHCRRFVDADGFIRNEGDVEVGWGEIEPYGIDYAAIVPKKDECANLIVPVCLSASHMAFGSIRMEPVFFALGQAAGTAAALACDAGTSVQDVDYAALRRRLVADGQALPADPAVGTFDVFMPCLAGDADDLLALAERMRAAKSRGGISRFLVCAPTTRVRVEGCWQADDFAKMGAALGDLHARLASEGIEVDFELTPTTKAGKSAPGCLQIKENGREIAWAHCPFDPAFRAYFIRNLVALAKAAHVPRLVFEDDYAIFGNGCFCARHLEAFSKSVGRAWTREALAKALAAREAVDLRRTWHAFQQGTLLSLSREVSAAVEGVAPKTRIGLCAPGDMRLEDVDAVAAALAGPRHRPYVRWPGSNYTYDFPVDLPSLLRASQVAAENFGERVEHWYEADPCPHTPFYASAARMRALFEGVTALGHDGARFQALGFNREDLKTAPIYLDMYKANARRFDAIRAETIGTVPVGLCVPFVRGRRDLLPPALADGTGDWEPDAWYRLLNRLGFPVVTKGGAVTAYSGEQAFAGMNDEEVRRILSGRVFLDGAAVEALERRGFGALLGVRSEQTDKIHFVAERDVKTGVEENTV